MIDPATDHTNRGQGPAPHEPFEDITMRLAADSFAEGDPSCADEWTLTAAVSPVMTADEAAVDVPVDPRVTTNLARIPMEQWGDLRVTKLSLFDDHRWDCRGMGSPLYTSSSWSTHAVPSLLLPENALRLRLLKAIVYYLLPHNSVMGHTRSYNTLNTHIAAAKHLARLFERHNLYADVHGNKSYRSINDLDRADIATFVDNHIVSLKYRSTVAHLLRFWYALSAHDMLPVDLQLLYQPIDDETLRRWREAETASTQPFKPIPLDTLSLLVLDARRHIETNGDDIIYAYESFVPILGATGDESGAGWLASGRARAYERAITSLRAYPSPLWNVDQFVDGQSGDIDRLKLRRHIIGLINRLRDACMVIILAVTGMRGSEAAFLEAGCAEIIGQGEYRLHVTVWKTSEASQGEVKSIPIPEIAFHAIEMLTRLSAPARQLTETPYIFTALVNQANGRIGRTTCRLVYHSVTRYCRRLGITPVIHPHQFRKTIALFIIYRDPRHLNLLKHLFSHKSLRMTWLYITSIPGLEKDVQELLMQEHRALFNEILEACDTGQIGGKAGLRIAATLPQSALFPGLLKADDETIDQYIASLATGGVALLHRTPYGVICTKTPGLTQRAPCDRPNAPAHRRFYPDLENCDPMECPFAVFTETTILRLENDIRFHASMTDRPKCSTRQRRLSLRIIGLCKKRLAEVRGETSVTATVAAGGAGTAADMVKRIERHG